MKGLPPFRATVMELHFLLPSLVLIIMLSLEMLTRLSQRMKAWFEGTKEGIMRSATMKKASTSQQVVLTQAIFTFVSTPDNFYNTLIKAYIMTFSFHLSQK